MDDHEEDPLALFSGDADDACIGEWTNEHLQVRIAHEDGRLVLQSTKKELVLTRSGFNEWLVAEETDLMNTVYEARVAGYGRDASLTLRPPRHKGSDKEAVLRRVEHVQVEDAEPLAPRAPMSRRHHQQSEQQQRHQQQHQQPRSPPHAGRRRGPPQPRGLPPHKMMHGHRGRSRSRDDSRSPPPHAKGPPGPETGFWRQKPIWRGQPPVDDAGDEEAVSTIFVTGLPSDAREEEVRASLAKHGSILRVVIMRRGGQGECNAFVRFDTLKEARRAIDRITDGRTEVCQVRVKAELARRNTN